MVSCNDSHSRSIGFSHGEYVGRNSNWNFLFAASQRFTLRLLWMMQLSKTRVMVLLAGRCDVMFLTD